MKPFHAATNERVGNNHRADGDEQGPGHTHAGNRRVKRCGFTLMELLVVLGILVLLIAIVTPKIIGTQEKADINAARIQIGTLKAALERYAVELRGFPTTEDGLEALVRPPMDDDENLAFNWGGPYINDDQLPRDPWGNEYQYTYPPEQGRGEYPEIWSYGPDGEDNTFDDICSWKREEGDEEGLDFEGERDFEMDRDMERPREPATRPSREPATRPSREPATRPATRPTRPAREPANR